MAETCPGSMKPSMAMAGSESSTSRAGGTSLWKGITKKFVRPCSLARRRVAATVGAVVSKPMPRKTTLSPGFLAATARASKGE